MTPKLLVSGASGFIGAHCIVDLLNNGYRVTGTLRQMKRADQIRSVLAQHTSHLDNLEIVQAELTNPYDWEKAMKGVDGVLHVASPVPVFQPRDPDQVIVPAREGTLNVLKAAKAAGVVRVVVTSSVSAVWGQGRQGSRVYGASDWTRIDDPDQSPYSLSKTLAEKAAWDFVAQKGGPELVVINPAFVFGPALEPDFGASLEIVHRLLNGKYPLVPQLGFEIVDVRDVAVLHRLAYENPAAAGQRFICSSGFRWLKDMAMLLRDEFPEYRKKISVRVMPRLLFRAIALFDTSVARFVPVLGIKREVDARPAREILGWQPRSPEEAIVSGARSLIEKIGVKP